MSTQLTGMVRSINRDLKKPLNILTAPTHEAVQTDMSKTGHNFYLLQHPTFVKWKLDHRPLPENHILLTGQDDQLKPDMEFDLILAQNIFSQFQIFKQLQQTYQLPLLRYEHTLLPDNWTEKKREAVSRFKGDVNVFISDFSRKAWGFDESNSVVVNHGIDTETFNGGWIGSDKRVLTIVNDWVNRDYFCGFNLWKAVTQGMPVHPVGNTPGLSKPTKDLNELLKFYRDGAVFLNTSLRSPVPRALLEAMAMGMPIVSTNNCAIPEFIQHGVNGFLTNDPNEMRTYLIQLLQDPKKAKEMGDAARRTIKEKFNVDNFVDNWNEVFFDAVDKQPKWGD